MAWYRKVSKRSRLVPVFLSAGLVIAALLLWPLSRGPTRRLTALVEVSGRLAQGDLSVRAVIKGKDEIDRLALRFNRMAQTLEKQRTARRNFFRAISHEIRSPLARIRIALDILAESDSGKEKKIVWPTPRPE
ncbi:MAG: HAMP domain-containing protein [Desulfosarcina sp.]|nr:HAMP domain-containing protein [Desulfobacterales bacterium]